jgi:hypothetical protein
VASVSYHLPPYIAGFRNACSYTYSAPYGRLAIFFPVLSHGLTLGHRDRINISQVSISNISLMLNCISNRVLENAALCLLAFCTPSYRDASKGGTSMSTIRLSVTGDALFTCMNNPAKQFIVQSMSCERVTCARGV